MRCPNCDREIPEGKKFCGFCGERLLPVDEEKPTTTLPQEDTPAFDEEAPTSLAPEQLEKDLLDEDAPTIADPLIERESPPPTSEEIESPDEKDIEPVPAKKSGVGIGTIAGIVGIGIIVCMGVIILRLLIFPFFRGFFSPAEPSPTATNKLVTKAAVKPTRIPTNTNPFPTSTSHLYSTLPFFEDFSDPNAILWQIGADDLTKKTFYNGGYRIEYSDEGWNSRTILNMNETDIVIEVDVNNLGIDNNSTGVICRYKNSDNFYALDITSDGEYSIYKRKKDEWVNLIDWKISDAIRTGNSINHIKAVCKGNLLSLYVNDQFINRVTDNDFSSGDIGLSATSHEDPGVDVLFDNFHAYKP